MNNENIKVNNLPIEEQLSILKDQYNKTRKLFLYYEKENKVLDEKIKNLDEKISNYEFKKAKSIKILFSFDYEGNKFYLVLIKFEIDQQIHFIKKENLKEYFSNIADEMNDIVEYNYSDLTKSDETINQVILQYDERIKRLNNELEKNENNIGKFKIKENESKIILDHLDYFYNNSIKLMLSNLNDIIYQIKSLIDDTNIGYREEHKSIFESFKTSIINENKNCEASITLEGVSQNLKDKLSPETIESLDKQKLFNTQWLKEMKNISLESILILINNLIHNVEFENTLKEKDNQLKNSFKLLESNHIKEINLKNKMIESLNDNISFLNEKLESLEQDKKNLLNVKEDQIESLNKELLKTANVKMLKSVIFQLLTTEDVSVSLLLLFLRFKILFCLLYIKLYNLANSKLKK